MRSDEFDSSVEMQIEQQNADYFAAYDAVKTLKNSERVDLLTAKNQFIPDSKAEVSHTQFHHVVKFVK